jgi:hypothetical protein
VRAGPTRAPDLQRQRAARAWDLLAHGRARAATGARVSHGGLGVRLGGFGSAAGLPLPLRRGARARQGWTGSSKRGWRLGSAAGCGCGDQRVGVRPSGARRAKRRTRCQATSSSGGWASARGGRTGPNCQTLQPAARVLCCQRRPTVATAGADDKTSWRPMRRRREARGGDRNGGGGGLWSLGSGRACGSSRTRARWRAASRRRARRASPGHRHGTRALWQLLAPRRTPRVPSRHSGRATEACSTWVVNQGKAYVESCCKASRVSAGCAPSSSARRVNAMMPSQCA